MFKREDTALSQKLGLKPGMQSFVIHAPAGYLSMIPYLRTLKKLTDLPEKVDWLQAFYVQSTVLEEEIAALKKAMTFSTQLWLSWPKKSSGLDSDLSDSLVRKIGLRSGLVDVKVAAIDEQWSGLKFVYRLVDRK